MKQTYFITIILILLLLGIKVFGHTADTTKHQINSAKVDSLTLVNEISSYEGDDDFTPGLFIMLLIGFGFILVCVGAGIVLTIIALVIVFGFVSLGVLSASIIVGLHKRSFTKGFITFLVSSSAIAGLIFWSTGFWILNKIMHWWSLQTAILTGATCGLIAGMVFGLIASYVLRQLTTYFKTRLKVISNRKKGEWDIEY